MKLKDIMDEWEKDCEYDQTQLDKESLKTPKLHNKYLRLWSESKTTYKQYESKYETLLLQKSRYYTGKLTKEELQELGWPQWNENKILKTDLPQYLNGDKDLVALRERLAFLATKIDYLESVLKAINNRNWEIRNSIEFMKFTSGQ